MDVFQNRENDSREKMFTRFVNLQERSSTDRSSVINAADGAIGSTFTNDAVNGRSPAAYNKNDYADFTDSPDSGFENSSDLGQWLNSQSLLGKFIAAAGNAGCVPPVDRSSVIEAAGNAVDRSSVINAAGEAENLTLNTLVENKQCPVQKSIGMRSDPQSPSDSHKEKQNLPAFSGAPLSADSWPKGLLAQELKERLETTTANALSAETIHGCLNEIFESLVRDISATRDRLLALNPGRRKMVEHRLEFIARKIARLRGEKLNRSLSLTEILKESYRDAPHLQTKLGLVAWKCFVSEVALYNVLELFFLKTLDVHGWREFQASDLCRMNFAAHSFLSQRAVGFAYDKHCWNFVRTNTYSWYVPSQKAIQEISKQLDQIIILSKKANTLFQWSDLNFASWIRSLPTGLRVCHLDFDNELSLSKLVLDLLENHLGVPLVSRFQNHIVCKKLFLPTLELGAIALESLDRFIKQIQFDGSSSEITDENVQLHRAIWACEYESFEVFWTEVIALLQIIRSLRKPSSDPSLLTHPNSQVEYCPISTSRIPQAAHVVQLLGLELHNMEQLPLGGPEVSKLHQGSAAQIQQIETFDLAVVTDNIDRTKSARWMKAIADQLPYWRSLVGNSTNLNWGELHLFLAISKLKEDGYCVYLSHKMLPEGGDGDRFRRSILNLAKLEYFFELQDFGLSPYRYLYIFSRSSVKHDRDRHHPRFGILKRYQEIQIKDAEEACTSQAELIERGWDQIFVRGAAPLIRHLNHRFSKLFQLATITGHNSADTSQGLFRGSGTKALAATICTNGSMRFSTANLQAPPNPNKDQDRVLLFPHNPLDMPWLQCLLNSSTTQFWIRNQLQALVGKKQSILQELRSCPIIDLSHTPTEDVHDALAWISEIKPDAKVLRDWALFPGEEMLQKQIKFVALSKRWAALESGVNRYRPLFTNDHFDELRADTVTMFYPASLLCPLTQSPDIRIQYTDRGRSGLHPENWTLTEAHSVLQHVNGKPMAYTVAHTRQGSQIQIYSSTAVRGYLLAQFKSLRDHTWGEALSMLRIPKDIPMFAAQSAEITRVVKDTVQEMALYEKVCEELALELFEVSIELRQFLPH